MYYILVWWTDLLPLHLYRDKVEERFGDSRRNFTTRRNVICYMISPILGRDLSFVFLTSTTWEAVKGKAKSVLPEDWQQWQYTLDNNFFENYLTLCWILLAICSTSWERTNAFLPCIDTCSLVSPPTLKFV